MRLSMFRASRLGKPRGSMSWRFFTSPTQPEMSFSAQLRALFILQAGHSWSESTHGAWNPLQQLRAAIFGEMGCGAPVSVSLRYQHKQQRRLVYNNPISAVLMFLSHTTPF